MNVQDIRLDVNKRTDVTQWVNIGQGDKGGTTIRATVFDNGVAATLTGMSARFELRMPNATYFEDTECTISGNVISYVVDESHAAMYAGGENVAYFAIYDGDTAIYSTERFNVRVERAASDGANPGRTWTNGIEEWLDEASDTLDDAVADANSRVGATINAANAAVEDMRADVDDAVSDTENVAERAEAAIDAMGDISELAVPLMSADTRGGAKLQAKGGLALRDGALGIGSLVQSGTQVTGPIAHATAKGWAEQGANPTPENPQEIRVARGRNLLDAANVVYEPTYNTVGTSTWNSTEYGWRTVFVPVKEGKEYVSSGFPTAAGVGSGFVKADKTTVLGTSDNSLRNNKSWGVAPIGAAYLFFGMQNNADLSQAQLTLGSTPQPYVPYGHVGMEVQGRNKIDHRAESKTVNGLTFTVNHDKSVTVNGTASAQTSFFIGYVKTVSGKSYVLSGCPSGGWSSTYELMLMSGAQDSSSLARDYGSGATYTETASADRGVQIIVRSGITISNKTYYPQLEAGSTATPYQPYCDSTTPIPLPSRGWVAGLPDGTADSLRLDGAGHVEWTLPTSMETFDGSSSDNWTNNGSSGHSWRYTAMTARNDGIDSVTDVLCNAYRAVTYVNTAEVSAYIDHGVNIRNGVWLSFTDESYDSLSSFLTALAQNPVTVLYPLATPVTEDCGYVDMPEISGECQVSIPELDALGVRYFVDGDGSIHALAKAFEARTLAEVAEARTAALANVAPVEGAKASTNYAQGSYLVHDGKLCKVTTAIASGESIAIGTNVAVTTVAAEILAIQE